MYTIYLANENVIGSAAIEGLDGSLILMYSSVDGKHFMVSDDCFRTVKKQWIAPIDSITANANLIRLKDGRLMTVIRRISSNPEIALVKGADFYTAFSTDEGCSFTMGRRINRNEACYYLMNQRVLRTHTGRILLPVCYVPVEYQKKELFENTGFSGCFYSDDEGESWQEGTWLEPDGVDQLAEPMVVQGEDSVLHMYMRTGYGYLYHAKSWDDGETWSKAEASVLRSPCAPFTVSFDSYTKKYFAVWDNSFPGLTHQYPRCPICLAVSDDCENWKLLRELDSDPMKNYGYPMLYFTEKQILITYYESPERKFKKDRHRLKLLLMDREEMEL